MSESTTTTTAVPTPVLSPQTVHVDSERVVKPKPPVNSLGISRINDRGYERGPTNR